MNINIYIEDSLGKCLNEQTKQRKTTRNAIIREAIKEWLTHHEIKKWPHSILTFQGIANAPSFESHRVDLFPPKEDPFA